MLTESFNISEFSTSKTQLTIAFFSTPSVKKRETEADLSVRAYRRELLTTHSMIKISEKNNCQLTFEELNVRALLKGAVMDYTQHCSTAFITIRD